MKKLQMHERYVSLQLIAHGILILLSFKNQEEIKAATQDSSAYIMCYVRTLREDTAPPEEMTKKNLRGVVKHFPRVFEFSKP